MIEQFDGEHAFLSNFSSHPVELEGLLFPTSEHAFQALKTTDQAQRLVIQGKATPGQAKRAGRKVSLRADWNSIRVAEMERVLRAKFAQHPELAERLRATGTQELVEGNSWNDTFWGVCRGKGANQLGKLLMKLRAELL